MALSLEVRNARKQAYARRVLKVMHGYWTEYTAMPSYGEIAERMGFNARSWAYECVHRLIESGHITKTPSGRLAPGEKFFDEL